MKEPAHKIFINRYLDWDLVKERLARYQNISKFFSLDTLQKCSSKPPFYCHFLSWRLGTWEDEGLFVFFDALLDHAAKMPNWNITRISMGCEFENFWSFIWELQIARLFSSNPKTITEWINSGPDLKVSSGAGQFFVECTLYRKSFGLEEFICELFTHIHPWIRVEHRLFNKFSLPKNDLVEPFLDELFAPFLNEKFLNQKLKEAEEISPVILLTPKEVENFYVFIESDNAKDSNPDRPWQVTGSPENYLDVVVREALDNKRKSNKLNLYKPNLLVVNLLLGRDYQVATWLRKAPVLDLGTEFDAVFLTTCGINEMPLLNSESIHFFGTNHPIKDLMNS
jgi:hypothetical protein